MSGKGRDSRRQVWGAAVLLTRLQRCKRFNPKYSIPCVLIFCLSTREPRSRGSRGVFLFTRAFGPVLPGPAWPARCACACAEGEPIAQANGSGALLLPPLPLTHVKLSVNFVTFRGHEQPSAGEERQESGVGSRLGAQGHRRTFRSSSGRAALHHRHVLLSALHGF